MRLTNTLTGEHLDVSRVANGYEYVLKMKQNVHLFE